MERVFGIPIIAAVILGVVFPYQALVIMPLGFLFLFLMMTWAGLSVEWSRLRSSRNRVKELMVGLSALYLFFPPLQWVLARWLISDKQYLFGLLFASLTPAAIVAPFFTRIHDSDEELSFLIMVLSTLVCPVAVPLLLKLLAGPSIAFEMFSLVKFMVLLVSAPLLLSYATARFLPGVKRRLLPHMGLLNMLSLSVLIFIFFGNATSRLNLNYASVVSLAKILLLVFVQDFGVLFLSRFVLAPYFDRSRLNALAITLSMKNVAIAAAVLLFYDPKAALPPAMAFIAHACLFNFIPLARGYFASRKDRT
ncbi:MAG: hypothetical protein JSV00_09530 [bacterium]|nr:MAG: hypothetical protein JSV00_09530 [bacterium]